MAAKEDLLVTDSRKKLLLSGLKSKAARLATTGKTDRDLSIDTTISVSDNKAETKPYSPQDSICLDTDESNQSPQSFAAPSPAPQISPPPPDPLPINSPKPTSGQADTDNTRETPGPSNDTLPLTIPLPAKRSRRHSLEECMEETVDDTPDLPLVIDCPGGSAIEINFVDFNSGISLKKTHTSFVESQKIDYKYDLLMLPKTACEAIIEHKEKILKCALALEMGMPVSNTIELDTNIKVLQNHDEQYACGFTQFRRYYKKQTTPGSYNVQFSSSGVAIRYPECKIIVNTIEKVVPYLKDLQF